MVLWYELHVSFDQIINKREETNKRCKSVACGVVGVWSTVGSFPIRPTSSCTSSQALLVPSKRIEIMGEI